MKASIQISRADMELLNSWFIGDDLGMAILIERECKRLEGKRWSFPTILKYFEAGKIYNKDMQELLKAQRAHDKKSRQLHKRLWLDFKKNARKKRKRRK